MTISSLGAGVQGAIAATRNSNVRVGFNIFTYDYDVRKDGVHYSSELKLRSVQATYDLFFGRHSGGFHISPGLLIWNGNAATANASVPAGQPFTPGGTTYFSSRANPVAGTGTLDVNRAAPMILVGFGNPIPRSGRRFGVNFEAGVVFQGSPDVKLHLAGTTCLDSQGSLCVDTATDPMVQSSIQEEQVKWNRDLAPFRYLPVVSLGFSYRF
ncbi:MAG TPA: hypothetical protein VHC72_19620 [Bryobacteraceae bacterium]|nr:hypothetical protein [Bryobacteraceae bacterium]